MMKSIGAGMLAAVALVGGAAAQDGRPPNVVILFCDDLGYGDLGCYGSSTIKTPNLDRLAAQGIRFTDFYSAYPVCSASRASLLTGCYQPRLNMPGVIGPKAKKALNPEEVTIADLLKTKGYATMAVGKWHVGDSPQTLPTAQGFDRYFGIPYSNDMARKKGWGNDAPDLDKIWAQKKWDIYDGELYRDDKVIESPVDQTTLTERYTNQAVKFIREKKDGPFFLYFAHTMPHVPLFVSDDRYDPDPMQAYRLTIEHIDASVGRVLDALDGYGLAENTLVVFSSDNGPWLPKKHHAGTAGPLRSGKGTTYEGGVRVPGIVRWPAKVKADQVCAEVAGTVDLLPTIAAVVGAPLPSGRPIDGLDVSGLLANPSSASPHDENGIHFYVNGRMEAIRMGKWKLRLAGKGPELYDLREDVGESKDVSAAHPDVVERLRKAAERYDADLKANARPAWAAAGS